MPSLANITVKKNDNTTDIVWTGVQPASGTGPSVWESQTVGGAESHRPRLALSARLNGAGKVRWMDVDFTYPQIATNTTTGVTSIVNTARFKGSWSTDREMAAADKNEFVSQLAHLLASTLMKDCVKAGYAAS